MRRGRFGPVGVTVDETEPTPMGGVFISCTSGRTDNEVGDGKRTVGGANGFGCKYKQVLKYFTKIISVEMCLP